MQESLNRYAPTQIVGMGDAWALVFAAATFLVPFAFASLRRDRGAMLVVWASLLLHQVAATVHAFARLLPGGELDAVSFHRQGVEWLVESRLTLGFDGHMYVQLLGVLYRAFGASRLLGAETSILAFALAAGTVSALADELSVARWRRWILAGFGLLPTMLFITSVTLRESLQILFFVVSTYWAVRYVRTHSPFALVATVGSVLALALWHKGLMLMVPLVPILAVAWPSPGAARRPTGSAAARRLKRIGLAAVAVAMVGGLAQVGMRILKSGTVGGMEVVSALGEDRALQYAAKYRSGGIGNRARADYGVTLDVSSPGRLAVSLPLVYVNYLFAPFPWQIRAAVDLYGAAEAFGRLVLALGAIVGVARAGPERRAPMLLCLVLFGAMTFVWALGTVNYGTAIRHHLVTNWLLLLLGVPTVAEALRRLAPRRSRSRGVARALGEPALT
ncbi:hypothetical protein [Roseisolibacter agri]|uniref:Uncharacterized protein n=1 Tax=Roseisolibacter agri TaxID=2014610 RepID=A0AA37V452_9BACT|nr:hypothetical protein [Roseisolibacter agri]GLC27477.1 hypothetical protein rosag_39900 [Roseisolibacter agri]